MAAPIGDDATHTAIATEADHRRLVCLDLACDTSSRVTIMTAPGADPAVRDAVAAALIAAKRRVTAIKDSPGFISQRISAMVANLGCYMAEIGLGTPADIDTAMKLGLGYPLGPLELAEDLGAANALRIMERLQDITGEDRYRPSAMAEAPRRARPPYPHAKLRGSDALETPPGRVQLGRVRPG